MAKIILGLAGEMASGKGTISNYISGKYKGVSQRFSTILRDVLDRLYLDQSRENMQNISTCLRKAFGEDILANAMSEDVKKEKSEIVLIDGVRRLPDIKYLRELPEFKLIYVEVNMKTRYERIIKRGENSDDSEKTYEEFVEDHKGEAELQIKNLKKNADFVIDNSGAINDLYSQVDSIISECKN
ncbi:AAA family ATPase [Patescibacteria group bacterium]